MKRVFAVLGAVLLLLLVVQPVAAAPPECCSTCQYYTVCPGDTLFSIGRAFGVSPWAIASHNGLVNPNCIYAGQVLAIPCGCCYGCGCGCYYPPTPPCGGCGGVYHTVASGQNLYRISLMYGVSMWRIAEYNGIYNLNYIRAGDVLCIP